MMVKGRWAVISRVATFMAEAVCVSESPTSSTERPLSRRSNFESSE